MGNFWYSFLALPLRKDLKESKWNLIFKAIRDVLLLFPYLDILVLMRLSHPSPLVAVGIIFDFRVLSLFVFWLSKHCRTKTSFSVTIELYMSCSVPWLTWNKIFTLQKRIWRNFQIHLFNFPRSSFLRFVLTRDY